METLQWALSFTLIALALAIPDFSDLQGDYCKTTRCCRDRNDGCSAPILGTRCYCDDFCDRDRAEDCCPDYWSHCKGVIPPPEPITRPECRFEGGVYYVNQKTKQNCNTCTCMMQGNTTHMYCDTNKCLMEPEMINALNQLTYKYGWSSKNYTKFWGRTLQDGVNLRLGTLQPERFAMRMNPVKRYYDPLALPDHFDSTEKWAEYMTPVQDQGWCGSSWAISTAAVASDRFGIISKGIETVQLSAQQILNCRNRGHQGCSGGHLDKAWLYVRKYGLVDETCFPYVGENRRDCPLPARGNLRNARCLPPKNPDRVDKYRVAPAYRLGNETDIMFEILRSGPVQATMKVYHDFFTYSGGIYKHSDLSIPDRTGYHSVRIVGWGETKTYTGVNKYWKVANSWGEDWGENGYFRIQRGTNECDIESFVLATWPETQIKSSAPLER